MLALISDIHGNLEALCKVLEDIDGFPVDEIYCLGDIVGYGPDPEACTDIVMERSGMTLMGNHDYALIYGPEGFNPVAADVIRLTHEMMQPESDHGENSLPAVFGPHFRDCTAGKYALPCLVLEHSKPERWQFIQQLPERHEKKNLLFVHASPINPISEYIFPDAFGTSWNPPRIATLLLSVKWLCFCGHTHFPCAISSDLECFYPPDCDYRMSLDPEKKYIINTGSVGQPRDHDNRACYLLFDEKTKSVQWRRIEYDIAAVMKKSEAMCGKDNWCALRLLSGR